jgi:tRNA A37 N6-isopentenylltransferase MiaA
MPELYVIDSTSLSLIREHPSSNQIWATLSRLIEEGRIRTVREALEELEAVDPEMFERLKPDKDAIVVRVNDELFMATRLVQENLNSRNRLRAKNGVADIWVLAVALQNDFTVVSDAPCKVDRVPDLCARLGVPCIDLNGLIATEALS